MCARGGGPRGGGLTTGAPRLLRGAAAGLSTALLAVVAHAAAGGALPDWPVVAGPILALGTLATGLARVRLRPATLLALLVLGQLAVHTVLSLGSGHAPTAAGTPRPWPSHTSRPR
ncbi:hypothetical protein BJF85_08935 [Saccharomonospora sp. CUA-673]|uniref:hypothetical protein n=1 Tax=Saccharomonospora sp. CUA-673 TaxID=1904969 RepID=UPI0009646A17|nr:hypothetical protein [Saccharomonospora sp. CUA-673]OLT38468.1 hypothetical protein BJF85_08935 [Saccharomonospora sp. CUA-673]